MAMSGLLRHGRHTAIVFHVDRRSNQRTSPRQLVVAPCSRSFRSPLVSRRKIFLLLSLMSVVTVSLMTWWQTDHHDDSSKPSADAYRIRNRPTMTSLPTMTPSHLDNRSKNDVTPPDRYVTLCPERMYGNHRLGNHLFFLSAMLYVAEHTGRRVLMRAGPTSTNHGWVLDDAFDFRRINDSAGDGKTRSAGSIADDDVILERYDASTAGGVEWACPCAVLNPDNLFGGDRLFDTGPGLVELRQSNYRTLALCGLYQVFRYADSIADHLRRLLRFREVVSRDAEQFRRSTRPAEWPEGSYFRVGLHVRRGDFLNASQFDGITVVDAEYLNRAIEHFVGERPRVQLVVATDDWPWTFDYFGNKFSTARWSRTRLGSSANYATVSDIVESPDSHHLVSVALSNDESRSAAAAVDLALLVECDAVIVSTGSFGWWAAWLSGRPVVYYRRWPRDGSFLYTMIDRDAYFPAHWIPMG